MNGLTLYIIIWVILIEWSLRSFFETSLNHDKPLPWRLFWRYRILAGLLYLAACMLLGNNIPVGCGLALVLSLLDGIHSYAESRITLPVHSILGLMWSLSLVFAALAAGSYLRVGGFSAQHLLRPVLNAVNGLLREGNAMRWAAYIAGYLFSIHGANRIVGWVLSDLNHTNTAGGREEQDASLKRAGRFIGSLERMFVITFMLLGQYAFAVGFTFTAKTFARFDLVRKQAEYYLVGTLTSMLAALGISACIRLMGG